MDNLNLNTNTISNNQNQNKNYNGFYGYCGYYGYYGQNEVFGFDDKELKNLKPKNDYIISKIQDWQSSRNLDKMEFNEINEVTNIIEEAMECLGLNGREDAYKVMELVKSLKQNKENKENKENNQNQENKQKTHEQVDAFCDIIVYSVGALMKLKYDPKQVLNECLKEINDRTGSYSSEIGKWVKEPKKENAYKANFDKEYLSKKYN